MCIREADEACFVGVKSHKWRQATWLRKPPPTHMLATYADMSWLMTRLSLQQNQIAGTRACHSSTWPWHYTPGIHASPRQCNHGAAN